jgi:hypothetical protein
MKRWKVLFISLLASLLCYVCSACSIIAADGRQKACITAVNQRIERLKAETFKLFPANAVGEVSEWNDCDEGHDGMELQARLVGDLSVEEFLRGFFFAGWSHLTPNTPSYDRMCYGCVTGATKILDGRVVYVAISSSEGRSLYAQINYQDRGPSGPAPSLVPSPGST